MYFSEPPQAQNQVFMTVELSSKVRIRLRIDKKSSDPDLAKFHGSLALNRQNYFGKPEQLLQLAPAPRLYGSGTEIIISNCLLYCSL